MAESDFDKNWKRIKTLPKFRAGSIECSLGLNQHVSYPTNEQVVIKKQAVSDDDGMASSGSKQFWVPKDALPEIIIKLQELQTEIE